MSIHSPTCILNVAIPAQGAGDDTFRVACHVNPLTHPSTPNIAIPAQGAGDKLCNQPL